MESNNSSKNTRERRRGCDEAQVVLDYIDEELSSWRGKWPVDAWSSTELLNDFARFWAMRTFEPSGETRLEALNEDGEKIVSWATARGHWPILDFLVAI
ncbi:hypothetical protein QC762_302790 [Podospora pseudocomata]|uniref:Uncharacterized protein n=1 Tax=Podospora pseudocomata TaxID=2093779 RepID=A0ABR0GIA8_9PEZI|nr:hypothetical protein QC762_302790 [Podospora pseudocomata]